MSEQHFTYEMQSVRNNKSTNRPSISVGFPAPECAIHPIVRRAFGVAPLLQHIHKWNWCSGKT
jgi:hypothetical protein